MKETRIMGSVCRRLLVVAICLVTVLAFFRISASAASAYEVTKSGGALVRTSHSEKAASVRREPQGSIIWVVASKRNSAGNLWYQLSDGNWIFSGNVKVHSCAWTCVGGYNPTCTSSGVQSYKCYKCGNEKSNTVSALGHKYDGHVCKTCGKWDTSSLISKSAVNNVKYYVTVDGAKVHSGPYGKCSTTRTLSKGTEIIVTEKVKNASWNIWYKYDGGYIFSDYVVEHNSCQWSAGNVTKAPTCTASGTKLHYCAICGRSKTSGIAALGHKYDGHVCKTCGAWDTSSLKSKTAVSNVKYYVTTAGAKVHSGPYGGCKTVKTLSKGTEIIVTEKVKNASGNIWYKYDGGYIFSDYVVKHDSHSWDSGKVTKKATCTATGTKVHKCTVCGESKTATIAKVAHKYKSNVCSACGNWNKSSLKSKTAVSNVKYYVTTAGAKVHSGPYGGCKTVKTLSKGTEIIVTEKVKNASGNIWYKYDGGYIFSDYVVKHDSHSWDSGKVTKKATCTATGTKVHKCTVCGKSKTATIAKVAHKYKSNVCSACGNWNKSSLKSKTTLNNVKYIVITDGAKVRSGPYSGCKTVKTLPKGTKIVVTEKVVNASKNTWYKYDGGYIYCDNVKDYALYTAKTTLNTNSATLYVGQGKTLKATVKGPSSKVTWTSSDTSVATVDAKGKITAKKTGTCTITAKANGKTATCKITVKQLAAPKNVTGKTLDSGRQFKISYKAVSGADGYEISYSGIPDRGTKTSTGTSATVTVSPGKCYSYKCYVRAYKLIDGKKYYSKASETVTVHVHNAEENIAARKTVKYAVVDGKYHQRTETNTLICVGCKKYVTCTKTTKIEHVFTCGICQVCGRKQTAGNVVGKFYPKVGSGPSYSSSEKKSGKNPVSVAVKYSDKFFVGNSSVFNEDLCKLSAVGAAVSYTEKYGKSFLEECGFSNIKAANSSNAKSVADAGKNDHAKYIIGHKKIAGTDKVLVAVLVNGYTTGDYEWISNFNVGKTGLHAGFSKAAKEITSAINAYIKAQKLDSAKVKIWLTGHSRAGAVVGISAVQLNEKYGHADVFAYGFATPNGVPNSMAGKVYSGNIFNIINPGDFVPYVVPSSWGFTKYGTVKVLSVSSDAKKLYERMTKDTYDGLTTSQRKDLIKEFCDYSPSRTAYYKSNGVSSPSNFGRALGLFLSEKGMCAEAAALLAKCGISDGDTWPALWQMFYNGKMTTRIHEAHTMETYIAMVFAKYP